jgi:N6-L-threonylcarbamoyladenine synthase
VPFRGIHHLRGHLASSVIGPDSSETLRSRADRIFPAWVVLVSGGHSQILSVEAGLFAKKIMDTADDAAGECLDKCAKLMGLDYPGGPAIEMLARGLAGAELARGQEIANKLPRPRSESGFSFSGLKTAFRLLFEKEGGPESRAAFAFGIQEAVFDSLLRGLDSSLKKTLRPDRPRRLVFCGGVAANQELRRKLELFSKKNSLELHLPPIKYSTDNAVMIAVAAWIQDEKLDLHACEGRIPLAEAT